MNSTGQQQHQGVPAYVSAANYNNNNEPYPPPPPPAYHEDLSNTNLLGQTYYQPPPTPVPYPPPPLEQGLPARNPVTQFYSPPDNRKLALKRRASSCLCFIVIIIIIIGLAAGLTRNVNYDDSHCECRTNADCISLYGPGVYCYQYCDCASI